MIQLKLIAVFIGALLLSTVFFKPFNFVDEPLSVYAKEHLNFSWSDFANKKIARGVKVTGRFKGEMNNLGIVAVRFNTFGEVKTGKLTFRIKENSSNKWYYESTYEMQKFTNNDFFPFGFPVIPDSESKEFIVQLEGISGEEDAVALLDRSDPIISKYQFTPARLLENRQFFKLIYKKIVLGTDWIKLSYSFLTAALTALVFSKLKFLSFTKLNKRHELSIIIVISIVTAFYLVGGNLGSKFGIIDDHWIMYYLGSDKKTRLSEIPELLMSTEVGQYGKYERFRPTFQTFQLLESFSWGDNPALWYGFRMLLLAASVGIFWYIFAQFLGLLLGFLYTLFVLTYPFWADIWTRLGPSEAFAVFGSCLYALGFIRFLKSKTRQALIMLFAGFVLAAGSKENLLVLLLPTIYLFVVNARAKKKSMPVMLTLGIMLLYGLFIASAIILAIVRSGHDVYHSEAQAGGRLFLVSKGVSVFIKRYYVIPAVIASFLSSFIILKFKGKRKFRQFVQLARQSSYKVFLLLLLFLSQYVFYNGAVVTNMRYDFPGLLAEPFILLVYLLFFTALIGFAFPSIFPKYARTFMGCFFLYLVIIRGFAPIHQAVAINRSNTNHFNMKLNELLSLSRKYPGPYIYESYAIWDYEPISSLQKFLRAEGISRVNYLIIRGYRPDKIGGQLEKQLAQELQGYSIKGSHTKSFMFEPLSKLPRNQKNSCISIVLSPRKQKDTYCSVIFYLN